VGKKISATKGGTTGGRGEKAMMEGIKSKTIAEKGGYQMCVREEGMPSIGDVDVVRGCS